jgi:hypothetical protein
MRILVTGSRDWPMVGDKPLVIFRTLDRFKLPTRDVKELLHGECPFGGVDALAAAYGYGAGWRVRPFPPKPSEGRTAIYPRDYAIRNQKMVDERPDVVLAFFLTGAKNRGTQLTLDMAIKAGIPYEEIWDDDSFDF